MTQGEAYPGSMFSLTDHELYIVSARHNGCDNGQIATWIMPATLVVEQPRIVALISPQNYTYSLIAPTGRFAVSMLSEEQHELVPRFGLYSGRDIDKFQGVKTERTASGLLILVDGCGWADCVVVSTLDAGDRILMLADIVEQEFSCGTRPLRKNAAFALQPREIRDLLDKKHRDDGERDKQWIRRF